ncbi:hypothetical protein JZU69_00315, partial [bacterium]|nr:hypothetical protein [bacterium]
MNELGPGVYFTKNPMYADAWSGGGRVEGGQTIRAFIKRGDLFDKSQKVDYLALAQRLKANNPVTEAEIQAKDIRANKSVLDWTPEESKIVNDASMELWRSWLLESDQDLAGNIKRGELNAWLARAGYIGATNKNSQVPDQVVVFDPKNIRSPSAKFNPKKADSANLLHQDAQQSVTDEEPSDDSDVQISQGDVPTSVDDVAGLGNTLKLAASKVWQKGRDLKLVMQDAVQAAARAADVDVSAPSPQSRDYLVRVGAK